MKKKWYEIIPQFLNALPFDLEPMIWFIMSGVLIFGGFKLAIEGETAAGTLLAALGGAGIARVRGTRKNVTDKPPVLPND